MLPAFKGRVNRKTFILGNLVGLTVLGFAALIYIVPLALIDIIINKSIISAIFKVLYTLFLIPVVFYLFFFSVLFVRRLHDAGRPGMLVLWTFFLLLGLWKVLDIWGLNIAAFLLVVIVTLLPGQKARNNFGPKPHPKFKMENIAIKL